MCSRMYQSWSRIKSQVFQKSFCYIRILQSSQVSVYHPGGKGSQFASTHARNPSRIFCSGPLSLFPPKIKFSYLPSLRVIKMSFYLGTQFLTLSSSTYSGTNYLEAACLLSSKALISSSLISSALLLMFATFLAEFNTSYEISCAISVVRLISPSSYANPAVNKSALRVTLIKKLFLFIFKLIRAILHSVLFHEIQQINF